jgi:hypothetical protein
VGDPIPLASRLAELRFAYQRSEYKLELQFNVYNWSVGGQGPPIGLVLLIKLILVYSRPRVVLFRV